MIFVIYVSHRSNVGPAACIFAGDIKISLTVVET